MGAALREGWLWLLLAFILGLAIGYFVKTWMGRGGKAATTARATPETPVVNAPVKAPANAPAKATTKAAANASAKVTAATKTTTKSAPRKPAVRAATLDLAAAKAAVGTTVKLDDLKLIEGIGPRIEALFKADGLTTWRELSKANVERLQGVLDAAGPRYTMHNPASWPKQAGLLADGKWADFKTLTDKLKDGR